MSTVVPSEYEPVAVSCCATPTAIDGAAGVTVIDCSVAEVTLSVTLLETAPEVALISVPPTEEPVASPVESIEATAGLLDDQATLELISVVVPSEYEPIAWSCFAKPLATDAVGGVTEMD